jgi:hypothetical protein
MAVAVRGRSCETAAVHDLKIPPHSNHAVNYICTQHAQPLSYRTEGPLLGYQGALCANVQQAAKGPTMRRE